MAKILNNVLNGRYVFNNAIYYLSNKTNSQFEELYIKVRKEEGRIYTNEQLLKLPYVENSHPLKKEWGIRKFSVDFFTNYIKVNSLKGKTILDLGCGNGWMTAYLHQKLNCYCLGLDLNETELIQAGSVFSNKKVNFFFGDVFENIIKPESIDIIVMAASLQYFPSVEKLFKTLFGILKEGGKIYLLDTPIYLDSRLALDAKERTASYYTGFGVEKLANYYHHITWNQFSDFNYNIIYNPNGILNKIIRKTGYKTLSPFPIIEVNKT